MEQQQDSRRMMRKLCEKQGLQERGKEGLEVLEKEGKVNREESQLGSKQE